MKFKVSRHLIVVCSYLIMTLIFIVNIDSVEKNKYSNIENQDYQRINILNNIDSTTLEQVIKTAHLNNVTIMKVSIDYYDNNKINKIYVSDEELEKYLLKSDIKYIKNKNYDNQSNNYFATTKTSGDNKAAYIIYDLLENDSYQIHTLTEYIDNGGYISTDFKIYYDDINNFQSFSKSVSFILGENYKVEEEMIYSSNHNMMWISLLVITVFSFFYFILEIYNIYNQSNKIAIMKLLGLKNWSILKRLLRNDLKIYTLVSIFLLVITKISIRNISILQLRDLIILYILLIAVFLIVSVISVLLIAEKKNIIDLLKNKKIIYKLIKINMFLKFIITTLTIITIGLLFGTTSSLISKYEEKNAFDKMLSFALFPTINENNDQIIRDSKSNLNNFYEKLNNTDIKYIYEEFNQYNVSLAEDIKRTNEVIKNGEIFPFATVDKKFIDRNKLEIYDRNENIISLNNIDKEIFMFSRNNKEIIDDFIKFYSKEANTTNFTCLLYEGEKIKTSMPNENGETLFQTNLDVKDPILRLAHPSYPINYIDDIFGISIAGNGIETGLKINSSYGKNETYNKLLPILKETNVEKILSLSSFATIGELMGEEIAYYEILFYLEIFILMVIGSLYIVLAYQSTNLSIIRDLSNIKVKFFLGFSKFKIFLDIYCANILLALISILILFGVVYFSVSLYLSTIIIASVLVLVIEHLIFFISIRKINLDKAVGLIKGREL